MKSCKFCTMSLVHINRDGLCAKCATLINKVKYTPDKVLPEERHWFDEQCKYNYKLGRFVPTPQRRVLKYGFDPVQDGWHCRCCGRPKSETVQPANGWKNYCMQCAEDIRKGRVPMNATAHYILNRKV